MRLKSETRLEIDAGKNLEVDSIESPEPSPCTSYATSCVPCTRLKVSPIFHTYPAAICGVTPLQSVLLKHQDRLKQASSYYPF
uniref:Uncharacterized protein n=1 Tax=Hyaloperonospora arabidopsidis (strain Emoy2) TaxID=559515 RepID=M4BXD2_HYAAE